MSQEAPQTLDRLAPGRFPKYLSLGDLPVETAIAPVDTETADHLIYVKHPYLGLELLQLLDQGCPLPGQDKGGATFDFRMPELAQQCPVNSWDGKESFNAYLLRIHRNDPRIGEPFQELLADSLDRINGALAINTYDGVLKSATNVNFINPDRFPAWQIAQLGQRLDSSSYFDWSNVVELAKSFRRGKTLARMLFDLPQFRYYPSGPIGFPTFTHDRLVEFVNSKDADKRTASHHFLDNLRTKEVQNLAIYAMTQAHKIVVGPSDKIYMYPHRDKLITVRLVDHNQVLISGESLSLKVKPSDTVTGPEPVVGKIVDYQFPEGYQDQSVEGLMAWRTSPEGDRFLTRAEAFQAASRIGLVLPERADVIVGRVMGSAGSKTVVKSWPPMIPLKDGRYDKTQEAVQSTILPKFKDAEKGLDHERDLFSPDNGLFQQLATNMRS